MCVYIDVYTCTGYPILVVEVSSARNRFQYPLLITELASMIQNAHHSYFLSTLNPWGLSCIMMKW